MTKPLLEIKDLQVSFDTYAGEVKAVRKVSYSVYPGEAIAVVGESGCGKSVTAQTVMGLIPSPPGRIAGGQILLEGQDLLKLSKSQMQKTRGNEISMIFQDPMTSLNPTLRVGYQISEGLRRHKGMGGREAIDKSIQLLKLVGIPNPEQRIKQYPHEFSSGMRQRAMIALALACGPKLLIADEPTTALDVTIQAQIINLMKQLQQQLGMAIILITHDLGVVAGMCSRVIVMYAGQIVESGSVRDIYYQPQHPYTKGLLSSVPKIGKDRKPLSSIPGTLPDLLNPPPGCSFAPRCRQAMKICWQMSPQETEIAEGHKTSCWLTHALASGVEREVVG